MCIWSISFLLLSLDFVFFVNFKRISKSWKEKKSKNWIPTQKRKVKKEATTSTNVKDNFCLTFTVSGHLEPEFVDAVQNITVPVGRDVKFSCHVRHLGTSYKVSFSFILLLLLLFWLLYFPFFFLLDILDFQLAPLPSVRPPVHPPVYIASNCMNRGLYRLFPLNQMIDVLDLVILCCRRHFMGVGPIRIFCPPVQLLTLTRFYSLPFSSIQTIKSPRESIHTVYVYTIRHTHTHTAGLSVFCWTFESAAPRLSAPAVFIPPSISLLSPLPSYVYCWAE
jgi:hypothetical protein